MHRDVYNLEDMIITYARSNICLSVMNNTVMNLNYYCVAILNIVR